MYSLSDCGTTVRNREFWQGVGQYCAMQRRPCVVGGDWQVTSKESMDTACVILLGCIVVEGSLGIPTCCMANGQPFIHFFLVSDALAAGVEERLTDMAATIPTHRPVMFSVQCDVGKLTSTAHVTPTRLPTQEVIGPRAPASVARR